MLLASDGMPGIAGTVFEDGNGDGQISSGEGREGVVVQLYGDNSDGSFAADSDALVATLTTGENGDYCFADIDTTKSYFVVRAEQSVDGVQLPEFVSSLVSFDALDQTIELDIVDEPDAPQTEFSIRKTDNQELATPGEIVSYTIVVINHGPANASRVAIHDDPPASLQNVTYTSSTSGDVTGNTLAGEEDIDDLVNMVPGSSITYRLTGTIASSATGILSNTATVSYRFDANPDNNSARDITSLTPHADLAILNTNLEAQVRPGQIVTYSLYVVNRGPSDAIGSRVTSVLPDHLFDATFTSTETGGAGGNTRFGSGNIDELVDLPAESTIIYTITGTVGPDATTPFAASATVTPPQGVLDNDLTNNQAIDVDSIQLPPRSADLSITMTDGSNFFERGNSTTYTIVVTNHGPNDVDGVTVQDMVPATLENVSYQGSGTGGATGFTPSGTGNIDDVVSLPNGSSVTYLLSGIVSQTATSELSNTATVVAPNGVMEIDPSNNSATDTNLSVSVIVLGSEPTVSQRGAIDGDSDTDFFQWTAHHTGKLITNLHFDDEFGDLNLQIFDHRGNVIASSVSAANQEAIVIPVVSQQEYFVLVDGADGVSNAYDLELENFAAPVPSIVRMDPLDDRGMLNNDGVTNVRQPKIIINADLSDFQEMGINILAPANPASSVASVPAEPGAAVEVRVTSPSGAELIGFATPIGAESNTFEFMPSSPLPEGEYFVRTAVRVQDGLQDSAGPDPIHGHTLLSQAYWMTLDDTPPEAAARPDLLRASDSGMSDVDDVTNKMQPAFRGVGEPGTKVRLIGNREGLGTSEILGQGVVNTDGRWEITSEPLVDGTHHIRAELEDLAGNSSGLGEPIIVEIDTAAPNTPFLDLITDSGISEIDNITNLTTPTVTITAAATVDGGPNEYPNDIKIRIYDRPGDGTGEVLIFDSFASLEELTTGGFFTETLPELSEGAHNLKLEIEDRAGNVSAPFLIDLEIDITPPTATLSLLASSDSGMLNNDGVTHVASPTFHGAGTIGDRVYLFAGGAYLGETVVGSDITDGVVENGLGAWNITVDDLVDGNYNIVARIEDPAGNRGTANEVSVFIDTQAPNTPFLDLLTDSGIHANDNITNLRTPTVAVVANDTTIGGLNPAPHDIAYRIYDRDSFGSEELLADSFVSLEGFTSGGFFEEVLPEFLDGVHNLKLEVEDRAGNISHDFLLRVEVDTEGPVNADIRLLDSSDTGMSNSDNVTRLDRPAFTGTGTPGDHVYLFANQTLVGETLVGSDASDRVVGNQLGSWKITSESLSDDAYDVIALVQDVAGNSVESASLTLEVDTIPPNTPFLDLREEDDTGRHNDDNVSSSDTLVFSATTHDANVDIHRRLISEGQNLKYRVFARPESGEEVLVYQSAVDSSIDDLLDGLTARNRIDTTEIVLTEGLHQLKLEVEDRAGNISHDFLTSILIDRTSPSCQGVIHGGYDSKDQTLIVTGESEANAVVTLAIDSQPVGTTVAVPPDGDDAFSPPTSPNDIAGTWRIDALVPLEDGKHRVDARCEDVAGNRTTLTFDDSLVVDTRRPTIENLTRPDGTSLFVPKPEGGPEPLLRSVVVHFADAENGVTSSAVDASIAEEEGHYVLVGDANGHIAIDRVEVTSPNGTNLMPRSQAELFFRAPLPDDRFTIFVSDSIVDLVGNRLDGESGARAPFEGNDLPSTTQPIFPTGDNVAGGKFVARFTVDSRPEIGTWAVGNTWIDINGNFHFDPENVDSVNRDIVYKLGFASDDVFAGNFALGPNDTTDGYDKLAVYGRAQGLFRWLVDTDNDGVTNIDRTDPHQANGIPVAGRFDKNDSNGDEVGLFDGRHWYFDTDHDFQTDLKLPSFLIGYPIVGDFDGDGFDDLATYADDTFMIDFAHGKQGGWDGKIDQKIAFGFLGVRERPIAADMDQDGFDDLGLWVPDGEGTTDHDRGEWYFLISDGATLLHRLSPQDDPINTNQTIDFTPIPFGPDRYARFGSAFARPVIGNFDPPTLPNTDAPIQHTNSENPYDVNNDGSVSARDVLMLVTDINLNGSRQLVDTRQPTSYMDVNRDGFVSPKDVLLVVGHINETLRDQIAEGERDPLNAVASWDAVASAVEISLTTVVEQREMNLRKIATDRVFSREQTISDPFSIESLFPEGQYDILPTNPRCRVQSLLARQVG